MKISIEGKSYTILDSEQLTNHEIMAIEKETGEPVSQWKVLSMGVMTGLVWATLRRETPELRFRDVNFRMADLEMEDDEEEAAEAEDLGKENVDDS